jgi:thiol peroxidase
MHAPNFRTVSLDLKEVELTDFSATNNINAAGAKGGSASGGYGQIKVLTSFPSLDTPVCDMQVKEFNKQASGLSGEVTILAISKDLPFAQKRFCDAFGIKSLTVLSDYRFSSFGINYGLLIKELNLLARSVLILDKNNFLRYAQVAPELTEALNYEEALKELGQVIAKPEIAIPESLPSKCKPCEAGSLPLVKEKVLELVKQSPTWQLAEDKKITKEFKFKDFMEAKYFLDLVSAISEDQGHHPTLTLIYNKLKITLTTHAAGGLTDNDFIMARLIDELAA